MAVENDAATDVAGDDDFTSAFAEAAKAMAPIGSAPQPSDDGTHDDDVLDDQSDKDDQATHNSTPPATSAGTSEQPARKAGTPAPADGSAPPAQPARREAGKPSNRGPSPFDADVEQLIASSDPRLKTAVTAVANSWQSDRGRIAAYQRQIADLTARLPKAPTEAAPEDAADPFDDPAIKDALDNYGDVLSPFVGVIKAQQAQLRALTRTVTADQTARAVASAADVASAEENAVRGEHADLDAIIAAQEFADWAMARPHIMPTIRANADRITDASAVIPLLAQFKRDTGWGATPAPTPRGGKPSPNDARRTRQLQSTAAVRTGGSPGLTTSRGADDFSSAFAEAAAMEARAQGR